MRRLSILAGLALLLAAAPAAAQGTPPLQATIFLDPVPPGSLYTGQNISIVVQLTNVAGSAIFTTEGFSSSEFWRPLVFVGPDGGLITNTTAAGSQHHTAVGFCFTRQRVPVRPTALPVVPVQVLASDFSLQFRIPDARKFFNLSAPGRYTVNAQIPFQQITSNGAVVTDCDQFPGETLVDVSSGSGRQAFTLVSNSLEFVVQQTNDTTPPVTTFTEIPLPNAAGWNNQNVKLLFGATDDLSGVNTTIVQTSGAQTSGAISLPPVGGSVTITAEGTTNVSYYSVDNAGNCERTGTTAAGCGQSPRSLTVKLDKTAPAITGPTPPSGTFTLNQTITVNYGATDAVSGLVAGSPRGTVTLPGGSPTPVASGASVKLTKPGTTTVSVSAQDVAGNAAPTASAQYAVHYKFSGFQSPLSTETSCSAPPARTAKRGSTVPVKFQLLDANNAPVANAVAFIGVGQGVGQPAETSEDLGTGSADTGNQFRFDPGSNTYQFNLDTGALATGSWCIGAFLDDGTVHTLPIGLR